MLRYRLRWFAYSTSRALLRRWQSLFIGFAVLLPAAQSVFAQSRLIATPVMATLSPQHGAAWRVGWLTVLELAAMLWCLALRPAIAGGPFMTYAGALPFTRRRLRAIDGLLLLLADTPLLVPVATAAVAGLASPHKAAHYLYLLALTGVTLAAQMVVLERGSRRLIVLLLINCCIVAGLGAAHAVGLGLLCVAALSASALIVRAPPTRQRGHDGALRGWLLRYLSGSRYASALRFSQYRPVALPMRLFFSISRRPWAQVPPLGKIATQIVFRQYRSATLSRSVTCAASVAVVFNILSLWSFDGRALPLVLLAEAWIAVVASGTYRDLRTAHAQAHGYVGALPTRPCCRAAWDALLVALLALPADVFLSGALYLHAAAPVGKLVATFALQLMLTVALGVAQRTHGRHVTLAVTLCAGIWTTLVWLACL